MQVHCMRKDGEREVCKEEGKGGRNTQRKGADEREGKGRGKKETQ